MNKKDFLYTAQIPISFANCSIGSKYISTASLEDLESLVPGDIDFERNTDLLGVAFNSAVVNQFNRNDDCILTDIAVDCLDYFAHKPTNLEHDKDRVVGHIVSSAFSSYPDNELISKDEVIDSTKPFNIALGAVVYRSVSPEFASLLERAMQQTDNLYQRISASWEIGFNEIAVALGNGSVQECEILYDKEQVDKYKKFLKAYKGSGRTNDGVRVRRIIVGKVVPLGVGFTVKPAADVKGVFAKTQKKSTSAKKSDSKISQNSFINVKTEKENSMDLDKFMSEIKEALLEKKVSEESIASMTSTFTEAIRAKDAEYRQDLEKAQKAEKEAKEAQEKLEASIKELQGQISDANEKLEKFENDKKAEAAVARFNENMELIDQEFDLEDADREFVATKLKTLDTEEAFASFKSELDIIWRSKNKEAKAEAEKVIAQRIEQEVVKRLSEQATASTKEDESNEEILDRAKTSEQSLANNNQDSSENTPSLKERFAPAFSRENITVEQ